MRVACEARVESSQKLFCQEYTNVAENVANEEGKPCHSTKSKLLDIIASTNTQCPAGPKITLSGLVVDLSVIIREQAAVIGPSEFTYAEFADHILEYIKRLPFFTPSLDVIRPALFITRPRHHCRKPDWRAWRELQNSKPNCNRVMKKNKESCIMQWRKSLR